MNPKVLIVVPPVRLSQPPLRFPLGLAYIAAVLEREGIDLSVLDLNALRLAPDEELNAFKHALQGVSVVATGGMITMFVTIARIAEIVHACDNGIPVVVGGPIGQNLQETILHNSDIDVLVSGEGEQIIVPLVRALINGDDLSTLPGLSYIDRGEFRQTSPPSRINELDHVPMPAYHRFPFASYLRHRNGDCDIIGSRGCPFRCTFCFRNFGNKVRFRSLDNIMEEILFLKRFYNVEHVHLEDELFIQKSGFVYDFCSRVNENGRFPWSACARVNTLTFDILKRMKEANCRWIMLGLESFDADILDEMSKGVSPEDNHRACDWMNELSIEIRPGLMIGMPGETRDSVQKTVEACIRHKIPLDKWNYAFATAYPGTELFDQARQKGLISDELAYIKRLSAVGDTCDLALNISSLSDEELVSLRADAIRTVRRALRQTTAVPNPMPHLRNQLGRLRRAVSGYISPQSDPLSLIQPAHLQSGMVLSQCRRLLSRTLKMIEIEVFSFCNRQCWYCPNSFIDRRSENTFMEHGVFCKILDNLAEIDYSEKVSFSRYNEPLADRHILTCIQTCRNRLPKATLHLNTNGDYLSHSMLGDLESAGLDSLNIQVYSTDREYSDEKATKLLFNKIESLGIPSSFRNSEPSSRLEYQLHYKDLRILIYARNFSKNGTDRGATIPELAKPTHRISPCLIPFIHMYIDYNGKVVPCCNIRSDYPDHEPFVLGDLTDPSASLFSVFASENAARMRRNLVGFWEKDSPCESCVFQELPDNKATRRRIDRVTRKARISQRK